MITLIRLASLIAALMGLSGCVTVAEGSCRYVHGEWTCSGSAGGTEPN